MTEWVVNVKGGPWCVPFEISVLRASNVHGKRSYGLFDGDKLLVSHSGGRDSCGVRADVWDSLVAVAKDTAHQLNACPEFTAEDVRALREYVDPPFPDGSTVIVFSNETLAWRDGVFRSLADRIERSISCGRREAVARGRR